MKKILFLILMIVSATQCTTQNPANASEKSTMKPEKNSDGDWDLEVMDSQYIYFLNAIAKPITMYTESSLKSRNTFLVNEWNNYYMTGKYRNIIESSIDYDPQENYGLKFEYKLYQVFAFVQWKYGLRLNGLSGSDVR